MLTETEARGLLHQAADTIEVGPAVPFAEPPRWHHGIVTVAAAVVFLVAVTGLVVWRAHRPPTVDRPQGTTGVPELVGYRTAAASDALRAAGLSPRIRTRASCEDAGRTLRTDPLAGTKVRRGTVVVVTAASDTTLRCPFSAVNFARSRAWELVDLARGLPGPRFADRVQLGVNDRSAVTLTASDAADATRWPACDESEPTCAGTALDVIRQALEGAVSSDRFLVQPRLLVDPTSNDGSSFRLYVGTGELGAPSFPKWSVSEQLDPDGAVTRVRLDYRQGPGDSHDADPSGMGRQFVAFADRHSDSLTTAPEIRLYVQHTWLRSLPASQIQDPAQWRFCPTLPAKCDFSAVDVVADSQGPIVMRDSERGSERCFDQAGPPSPVAGVLAVVVRPAKLLPCSRAWAVYLYRNRLGRIVGVDLMRRAP